MKILYIVPEERPHSTRYSGVTPQPSRSNTSDFALSRSSSVTDEIYA